MNAIYTKGEPPKPVVAPPDTVTITMTADEAARIAHAACFIGANNNGQSEAINADIAKKFDRDHEHRRISTDSVRQALDGFRQALTASSNGDAWWL